MFVYIEEHEYRANTSEEIEEIESLLFELGIEQTSVYCGQGPDQFDSGLYIFACEHDKQQKA